MAPEQINQVKEDKNSIPQFIVTSSKITDPTDSIGMLIERAANSGSSIPKP